MAILVRVANQSSPLFKEKNYMFVSKKMEILQEKNKSMYRYCFSLNSICEINWNKANFLPLLIEN